MQVLAGQLYFLANRNAGHLAVPPLFWPVNCIKIGEHVERLGVPTVQSLYCDLKQSGNLGIHCVKVITSKTVCKSDTECQQQVLGK